MFIISSHIFNLDGMAGRKWLTRFKRNELVVRVAQATSLARATGFNRYTVGKFCTKLGEIMDKYQFAAKDIYNFDESGI